MGRLRGSLTEHGVEIRELEPEYWRKTRGHAAAVAVRLTERRDMEAKPMALEGLRAWKQEYAADTPAPGGGLPYTADDHVHQVKRSREMGIRVDPEEQAAKTGIPKEYWEEVIRYVEAEERG